MPFFGGKSKRKKDRPPISAPTVVKEGMRVVDDADRMSPIRGSVEDLRRGPSPFKPSTPTLRTHTVNPQIGKGSVSQIKQFYEDKSSRPDSLLSSPSSTSRPTSQLSTSDLPPIARLDKSPFHSTVAPGKTSEVSLTFSFDEASASPTQEHKEPLKLKLPPLSTSSRGGKRKVELSRRPQGGFGIKLSLSAIPDPSAPNYSRMGFLIEPRSDASGRDVPLVTGDVLLTVNGIPVEGLNYDSVVDLIKTAGQSVVVEVACLPELIELSERGALEILEEAMNLDPTQPSTMQKGRGHTTGTLRRARSKKQREQFRARTIDEVKSEKAAVDSDRLWLVHKDGYTAVRMLPMRSTSRSNPLAIHMSMVRTHGRDTKRVKLEGQEEIMEVAEEDLEKANPSSLDQVEDLTDLAHLNEPSVVHVLRQRYANSLVHTYAGRHTIIINPIRQLASYSDKVLEMFHGGRREDMPPHIFAIAQQAYHSLITDHRDQSLVLMGLSGAGKTFNARHLLRYLATAGGCAADMHTTLEKFQAAFILLRSFGSAATYLNPESTRFTGVYTVEYDALGSLQGATFKGYLLEKVRVAQRAAGEAVFNIFHNLLVGADAKLQSDLQLDIPVGDSTNAYINLDQHGDKKQRESAAKVWAVLKNCIAVLGIAAEEEKALWSLLAAVYHLGYAAVKRSEKTLVRGGDRFMNPAASQRAAAVLGVSHEDLGHFIFSPPRGVSMRIPSNVFGSTSPAPSDDVASQSPSITSLTGGSPFLGRSSGWDSLSSFCMGLYEQAFNALILLINRSLQPSSSGSATKKHKIHVLDPPGLQDITLSEHRTTATFDELCDNYAMERLQMLFHDSTFTAEQERYIQEEIQYSFSDVVSSPLPVIDVIDRNVPMRRGVQMDLSTDKRGLLWILDEESIFPGATDTSFLERLQIYHGVAVEDYKPETSDLLVTINKDNLQFTIRHCHRSLPIAYDVSGWVRQARDHPSYRVVPQVLNESKRNYIASVFQGRGVAAAITMLSASSLKQDARRQSLQKLSSFTAAAASAGVKKSSVCLQTKFQLDSIIDELRKSNQWFVHCLLPHQPHRLPHALGAAGGEVDKASVYGCLDVPLVWSQLKRSDLVKVARLYKQGFPEHMTFTAFRRRYEGILPMQRRPHKNLTDKQATDMIVDRLELKKASLRIGLSQIFFRAGITGTLEQQLEEKTSHVIAYFQARCRGYLARRWLEKTEVKYNAACILQRNIRAYIELRDWQWWRVLLQLKPVMAVRKTEEERKELADQTESLKKKLQAVEEERDHLRANEQILEEKLAQVSARLDEEIGTASHLSEALEQEQCAHRETREKLTQVETLSTALEKVNEDLRVEMAQKDILRRIQQSDTKEDGIEVTEENAILMEKYRSAQRELEGLRLRLSSEREEDMESLQTAKRNLDKKVAEQEGEIDDLRRTLSQLRKKLQKQASEMNDLQLLLESQQARNEDLEKKQRRFDTELSSFKAEATREKDDRERIQKEKDRQQTEMIEKEAELRRLREEFHKMKQEKEELEAEFEQLTSRNTSHSEVASLKSLKRELENKVAELEDELDEANMRLESLEQAKSRLDLSTQTAKQNYQKELDARDEELDKIRSTMNKRVRSLEASLEEEHSERQSAVKEKQRLEVQLEELQASMLNPMEEQKLRKQLKKSRALIKDLQQELEYTRESGRNSTALRAMRHKLEEKEDVENSLSKTIKKLQAEVGEVQELNEDLERRKVELEAKVSELTREKNELELRCEEEQDEVEEMAEKQRQYATKITHLERQLVDANVQVSELEEQKEKLERDVSELQSHVSQLQAETPRMNDEVVELRVKEMQQKVDMEAATRKRMENQVQRLKNQLEKVSTDKVGGYDADKELVKKYQRQLKDMKEQVKEAEAREQEVIKKKRMADSQVEELEAILEATKMELRSSNERIKSLQRSLAGDADDEDDNVGDDEYDAGGSDSDVSAGSYQIGQYASTDDDLDGDPDGECDEVDKFLKDRRNRRSKNTADMLNDDLGATDEFGAGKSRKRLDELLASEDTSSAAKPRKLHDGSTTRGVKTTSDLLADDDDLPVLSSRTRQILDEGSDIEDIPSIKPRKTLEELLRSDSDEENEDL